MEDSTPTQSSTQASTQASVGEAHDPAVPPAYAEFMRTGWGDRELDLPAHPITPWARARRERLSEQFSGERLVVRTLIRGAAARSSATIGAASRTCSKLSRTIRVG